MTDFLQIHLLTTYPPSNVNRDDTGRPKRALFGNVPRVRISSQSLKRAWRESSVFAEQLHGYLGKRTQRLGYLIVDHLESQNVEPDKAQEIAREVAGIFGKIKSEKDGKPTYIEQLAFVSPEEMQSAINLANQKAAGEDVSLSPDEVLSKSDTAADIAMFGRMLAQNPEYNREAAVQVSHAITTNRAIPEDDYYTALDDLKTEHEDAGAGFLGVQEFGSGVFYLYICVDLSLLLANLSGNRAIRDSSVSALVSAAATTAPRGKQNSFASRPFADYVLIEKGTQQPRTLAAAFLNPVGGENLARDSIARLEDFRKRLEQTYGQCADEEMRLNVGEGEGNLDELVKFAVS